ncbi:MAG: BatD family protein, partial [Desulfobacula sp.]|nr:BatD family protein [Desulfobacula sp.]
MNLKRIFFISMVLLVTIPAAGFCFDVTSHVDKTRISRDDSIFLKVEVNGGKADLDFSMVKDFKVIPRGSSSSYNYINGKSERKATYNFVLMPLSTGELKIPVIKATRDSEIGFTREIVIHVSDRVVKPGDIKALFARADVANA